MLVIQDILGYDRDIEVTVGPPAKAQIQSNITANARSRQGINIADGRVKLEIPGKVHQGAKRKLMTGTETFVGFLRGIGAAWILVQFHFQIRVGGPAMPPFRLALRRATQCR